MQTLRNREFKHCENTELACVLVRGFREVGEIVVRIVDEHRVMWDDGISPGGNTPHWAKAQRVFPLALLSWKKECGSECGSECRSECR